MTKLNLHDITILFLGLKLTGHLDWPYWKVLAPSLIAISIALLIEVLKATNKDSYWERLKRYYEGKIGLD